MKQLAGVIARRYGTALFEVVTRSTNMQLNNVVRDMLILKSFFSKSVLKNLLSPSLSAREKTALLDVILSHFEKNNSKLPNEIGFFFKTLLLNQRLVYVDKILDYFFEKADEKLGIIRASLVGAFEATPETTSEFEKALSTATGKKTVLVSAQDPSLLSGFVVRIGNTQIDASLKSRVNRLKISLH